jgi:sugar phosphate isomerase/epimerase
MKIGYSNLACPDWTLEQAFDRGAQYGYDGIELQAIGRSFLTPRLLVENLHRIRNISASSGCRLFAIGTAIALTGTPSYHPALFPPESLIESPNVLSEMNAFIEIAGCLGAEFLRVFGNWSIANPSEECLTDIVYVVAKLTEAAAKSNVKLALESYGCLSNTAFLRRVIDEVDSPQAVALWDILHPYLLGESVASVWGNLEGRLGYVHVQDGHRHGEKTKPVPLGEGEVPVREVLRTLAMGGFDGFVSLEWEKAIFPELAGPELALPATVAKIWQYSNEVI